MTKNTSYKKYLKFAFIINAIGIVFSFVFEGSLGVLGTIFIMAAIIIAVIGVIKKKRFEKNQENNA